MKFSHNWLNEYLSDTQNPNDLANTLTLAGLEVDAIQQLLAEKVSGVVVGQIQTINKHPNADKLNICVVDIAKDQPLTIVCGADNIYQGMKAPVAKIGAVLPGNFKIKKSKLRGQISWGMMCSEAELGLTKKADGLMNLPDDAPVGKDINDYLELDDKLISIDLTPNRADCLSIYGIAREISALTKTKLKDIEITEPKVDIQDVKKIKILAPEACKSYYGCIIKNVNPKANTPLWMQERLRRSDIASVSFLVDVTNYVMLLLGQPMHVFDLDKLEGDINVRFAKDGEELVLLDKTKAALSADTLVIADQKKALAIAGVMGGLQSSVDDDTTNIFLESAFFVPKKVTTRARRYNLNTESSYRFERGVDPKIAKKAIKLAIQLITNIASGKVGKILGQEDSDFLNKHLTINLCIKKLNKFLGTQFTTSQVTDILKALNMQVKKTDDYCLEVNPPSYRFDIEIPENLIEEVARVDGYSKLPATMPKYLSSSIDISETKLSVDSLQERLVNRGYHETINYSFIDLKLDEFFFKQKGIAICNPISKDLSVMRQSLIPGLLNTFKANISRQQNRVRIFEKGACFKLKNNLRVEFNKIAGLAYGELLKINWSNDKEVDFFDVKADIEALCNGISDLDFKVCSDIGWLHPGQSAYIFAKDTKIGIIGLLHPSVFKALHIKVKAAIVFELDLEILLRKTMPTFRKISKYPMVSRDISFMIDKDILASEIIKTVNQINIDILKDVNIFDVYQDQSTENKKSLALNMLFQDNTQTLDDKIIVQSTNKVLEALKNKFNIKQRVCFIILFHKSKIVSKYVDDLCRPFYQTLKFDLILS